MKKIKRHVFDCLEVDAYRDELNETIDFLNDDVIPAYKTSTEKFDLGLLTSYTLRDIASYSILPNKEQSLSQQSQTLVLWQDISKAFYTLAYGAGQQVKIRLQGEYYEHKGVAYNSYMDFPIWLNTYSAFIVLRDREGLAILEGITESSIERSTLKWNEMERKMVQFFANFHYNDVPTLQKELSTAIKSTHTDSGDYEVSPKSAKYYIYIYEALLWVYNALLNKDEKDFNEQLEIALDRYKEFYDRKVYNRYEEGWINWLLLAPMSIAYDIGMSINIQSDYVPEWLYKAEFDKNFIPSVEPWS